MQRCLTVLVWTFCVLGVALSSLGAEKASGCDRLCGAMHALSPYGDKAIYDHVARAAQRHAALLDPYTVVAIAFVESTLRQVVSAEGTDVGLFQFATFETARLGIDEERLLVDVNYAFAQFRKLMREKKSLCETKYPETWFACWHSATPERHYAYAKKVERYAALLKQHAERAASTLTASQP